MTKKLEELNVKKICKKCSHKFVIKWKNRKVELCYECLKTLKGEIDGTCRD